MVLNHPGACSCENTSKTEELKNSSGSIGTIDACRYSPVCGYHPSSSEISMNSVANLCGNVVQQGAEHINNNVHISLTKKNDGNEVLAEDKNIVTYQRRKRPKNSELPEFGSASPLCSEGMSERLVFHEEENLIMDVERNISSKNDAKRIIDNSNENTSEEGNLIEGVERNIFSKNIEKMIIDKSNEKTSEDRNAGRFEYGEQSVATDADHSLKESDDLKGVVNKSINLAVNRETAGYKGKKLLVLDLNGLLVHISSYVPYDYDPDDIIMKKAVFKRPYCDDFLKFCFERFNVGIWSSRTMRNVEPILDFLLGNDKHKLLFCWDQSHCTDTGYYTIEKRQKPLLLKKLKKLWNKCEFDLPWEKGVYNESNTLLLDDSPHKALSNPRYTAIFPKTYHFRHVGDNSLGPGGDLRVYLEGLAAADNVQEYVKQNPFGQRAITEKNLSWKYYLRVIEASSTPPR